MSTAHKITVLMVLLMAALTTITLTALAKSETQAVSSPKCDLSKVSALAKPGLIKIEKGSWEGSYNVTLDTDKMTFDQLLQKLVKEKCF